MLGRAGDVRVFTNVFEITVYLFLFHLAEPLREQYLGYSTLGFARTCGLCLFADDHSFYWHLCLMQYPHIPSGPPICLLYSKTQVRPHRSASATAGSSH